jgi:hypothetical protein
MKSDKLFFYLHRFNALLPAAVLLLLVCLLGWALLSSQGSSPARQIIAPLGASSTDKGTLRVQLAHFDGGQDTLIFLVNAIPTRQGYEGRDNETRNLLFVSTNKEKAQWLFPDQEQTLSRILTLDIASDSAKAIYIETKKRTAGDGDTKLKKVTLSLVLSDGSKLTTLIPDADEVMGHRLRDDDLQVTYQKEDAIRSMRISMTDFKVRSDRLVVSLREAKK